MKTSLILLTAGALVIDADARGLNAGAHPFKGTKIGKWLHLDSEDDELPDELPAAPQRPEWRYDGNPGLSPGGRSDTRPATVKTARPTPAVQPESGLKPLPADMRSGAPAVRRGQVRSRTRAAFARAKISPVAPAVPAIRTKRLEQRARYGAEVRASLRPRSSEIFTPKWWESQRPFLDANRWHYGHRLKPHQGWRWATWDAVRKWLASDANDPWTYDYDDNVVIENEVVFIDADPVGAAEDYIAIADSLTEIVFPPDDPVEWLPLGTFALSSSKGEKAPHMMIQLAIAKDRRIAGTYYSAMTRNVFPVRGSLDRGTQRVAFEIGSDKKNLVEVGLSGLTDDQAPVWIHFAGRTRTQTWTLVRLEVPEWAEKASDEEGGQPRKGARPTQ